MSSIKETIKAEIERRKKSLRAGICNDEAFTKKQKEEKMIEELKEHIYGYDQQGNPAVAGPPPLEEVIEKVNEIIRYLNATQRK